MAPRRQVRIEQGAFRFSGDCDACRPACLAACCRTMRAALTAEEAASGRWEHETVDGVQVLRQGPEGCVYLEKDRCRIYAERPAACRAFDCAGHLWRLYPVTAPRLGSG